MNQTFILRGPTYARILASLTAFLGRLPSDKGWQVTVAPYSARRSDQQNRYLWAGVYGTLEQATGQDAADWHEYMLGEWGGWDRYELFGRAKIKPKRRSSKLSKVEFADYVAFIQRRAAEYGIHIPDPDQMLEAA